DGRRLLVPDALAVGPRADVDGVLEDTGHAAIIFGRTEQYAVRRGDPLAETDPCLRRVGVEVLVVERQVPALDHRAIAIVAAQCAHGARHLAVDAVLPQAADKDGDFVVGHGASPICSLLKRSWNRLVA